MKKTISIILCLLFVSLSLCACTGSTEQTTDGQTVQNQENTQKLRVVTTSFPAYDFVRQIAGDKVELSLLLPLGGDVHSFSPSADDMVTLNRCNLFIGIGGESEEGWVEDTFEALGKPIEKLDMLDCVSALEEEHKEGMEEEHEHEEEEEHEDEHEAEEAHESDEHVWTSPLNSVEIVKSIAAKLGEMDSVNAEAYKKASEDYSKKLTALDVELKKIAETAKYKTLVFADRFPFRYFTEAYGFDYFAAFAGCSASADPSAKTISFLVKKVKELKLPVVFTIEFSSGATAKTICEATGARAMELHSCHNVTVEDFNKGITYVDLMERNINTLKEALDCNVTD